MTLPSDAIIVRPRSETEDTLLPIARARRSE